MLASKGHDLTWSLWCQPLSPLPDDGRGDLKNNTGCMLFFQENGKHAFDKVKCEAALILSLVQSVCVHVLTLPSGCSGVMSGSSCAILLARWRRGCHMACALQTLTGRSLPPLGGLTFCLTLVPLCIKPVEQRRVQQNVNGEDWNSPWIWC